MSSKHLLLLILSLVLLAAPALADYAKPTELGKRKRPAYSPPLHGMALPPPQGPIRGRHSPPPHGKPTPPPPPPQYPPHFNMTPPPPPPHERGSLGPAPEPSQNLFPGRHYHGFMPHHRPSPQGPELFKRPIRGQHNPPPHGKPTPPAHWDPPPFAMPPPPSPEPGSPGPTTEPSEKLFPGRRRLLAHASFINDGHHPTHSPILHHGSHHGMHLPMECGKGPHMCWLPA